MPSLKIGGIEAGVFFGRITSEPSPAGLLYVKSETAGTVDGANVTTWPDSSGNGNNATASGTAPILKTAIIDGRPVVRFASPSWMTCGNVSAMNFDRTSPFTAIWVGSVVDAAGSNFVIAKEVNSGNFNGWYCLMGGGANNTAQFLLQQDNSHTAAINGSTILANNTPYVVTFINSGAGNAAGMSIYVNGVLETATAFLDNLTGSLLPNTAAVTIGSRDAGGVPLNGDSATGLVFGSALTTPQRQGWENFLLSKYAINPARLLNLVICDGNSLTLGLFSSTGHDYPSVLSNLLGYGWSKFNFGVGGQTTEQMNADAATQVDPLFQSSGRTLQIVVFWEGRNSMVPTGGNETPAQSYSATTTYVQGRRAAGFKVIVCTIIDDQGSDDAGFTANQIAYNNLAVANTAGADLIVRLDQDSRLSDATNATYFNADKIHLTDAGYAVVAALVYAGMTSLDIYSVKFDDGAGFVVTLSPAGFASGRRTYANPSGPAGHSYTCTYSSGQGAWSFTDVTASTVVFSDTSTAYPWQAAWIDYTVTQV